MAFCASGVGFASAIAPFGTSASAITPFGTSAFGSPRAHPPAQPLALGGAALEIKQVSGLYSTFETLTICKGDCWGRFTSTCPAQGSSGHQLFWASGAALQTALLAAPPGAQDTAAGLALDFRQLPVPCYAAPPSSAWAHVASSGIYMGTWLFLGDSHMLWQQAGAEHPLPTTSSSSCDADLREARALPGLSSLQRGPASPPHPGDPSPPSLGSGNHRIIES